MGYRLKGDESFSDGITRVAIELIDMVTAKTSPADFANAKAAGVDDYITKPFSVKTLLERIDFLLKRSEESFS
jgi:DNA-binding response OmpR family regulator